MYSRVNYTLIGLFVVLFSLGILYFAFWLGGRGSEDSSKLYMLRMRESISGLSKDSGVKLKGVNIGTVKGIRVNPKNIEEVDILLSIDKNIPIKVDMRGVIKMFGLTGLSYVEIEGGSNSSQNIESKDGERGATRLPRWVRAAQTLAKAQEKRKTESQLTLAGCMCSALAASHFTICSIHSKNC